MLIRIASTRAPKVNGVKRAFEKIAPHFSFGDVRFESVAAESNVAATPRSIEELMTGAQFRAHTVFVDGAISIGVEGGLFKKHSAIFLQSWSCAYNGSNFFFGSSGSIEIPSALANSVFENGEDLGSVIDLFAEQHDVRSNQGTWGILTNDIISREDSFELATLNALMPLFNTSIYKRAL